MSDLAVERSIASATPECLGDPAGGPDQSNVNLSILTSPEVHHWFLINMFLRVGFSPCLQAYSTYVVFMQPGVNCHFTAQTVAARHLSSCWRLLLSSAPCVRKSTELLQHNTPDFTPDVAPNRPHLSSTYYISQGIVATLIR